MKLTYISQRRQLIKSFYAGIGKTAVIFPAAFLAAVGMGLMALGIIFYLVDIFQASASQIGLLAALWSLCYVIGCLLIRPLFDRLRPRHTMIIAMFSMSLFTFLLHYAPSIVWVYVWYGLFGLSTSLFWPPLMAWLSRGVEGRELSRAISKFNFSWSAGVVISPFLTGWLSEKAAELPLYLGSLLFLLIGFMIIGAALALPYIRRDRDAEPSAGGEGPDLGEKDTFLRYPAWIGLYTTYVVMGVILVIFPIFARGDLSLSKSVIGLLLLSRALFMTGGFIILGKVGFWHFRGWPMILVQLGLAIILIFMVYLHSPFWLGLALAFMGLLMALAYANSLFHGVSGSTQRTRRMAIHEVLLSLGIVSGSSLGGILYERYSMSTVYWFCLSLVLVGAVIQVALCLKGPGLRKSKTN